VNLYDVNGFSAMKRVLERGDDASSVKPLVTIVVNYPVRLFLRNFSIKNKINNNFLFQGSYNGPWINSEHMAGILAILVFYLAYSTKRQLLA
jgi:translocon-associated protein subunit delta